MISKSIIMPKVITLLHSPPPKKKFVSKRVRGKGSAGKGKSHGEKKKKHTSLALVKSCSVHLPGCPKQKPLHISLFQFPGSSWITDWHPLSLAHRTMSSSKNPSIQGPIQKVRKEYKTALPHTLTQHCAAIMGRLAGGRQSVGTSALIQAPADPETHYTACGHTEQHALFVSLSPNIWHYFTESTVPKGPAVPLNIFQDTSKTWSAEAKAIRTGEVSCASRSQQPGPSSPCILGTPQRMAAANLGGKKCMVEEVKGLFLRKSTI